MSLSIFRHFRPFRGRNLAFCRLDNVEKACIHCCAVHRVRSVATTPPAVLPKRKKPKQQEEVISDAMKAYLERRAVYDKKVVASEKQYQLGKRHLANIMGVDEETFTPEQISAAVQYLLPSGLFAKTALPMLENTMNLLPKLHAAQFSKSGKPNHYLFYTCRPQYHETMHQIVWKLEVLNEQQDIDNAKLEGADNATRDKHYAELEKNKLDIMGSTWIGEKNFSKKFPNESVFGIEHRRFITLMDRLIAHPLSHLEKEFILQFRPTLITPQTKIENVEPMVDDTGRKYSTGIGNRKSSEASVKVYAMGSGKISINNESITYFKDLMHRKQVLFPLQFADMLGEVDVVARVREGGPTGQSGAIRLAISRALTVFVTPELSEKMRLAGLLTRDPRIKERQKAGQQGARRKHTWKRR